MERRSQRQHPVKDITNQGNYRKMGILLLSIYLLFLLLSQTLEQFFETDLIHFKIMPMLWCGFIIVFALKTPRVHPIGRLSKLENLYLEAIICAAILIGIQFIAGSMIGEMGESPYVLTPGGILHNFIFILPPLAAREIVRSYLLCSFCRKSNIRAFILITAVMTLSAVNFQSFAAIQDLQDATIFLSQDFGPLLCQNIMLSYLALYGGAAPALCYVGLITIFHWTSPILPVLNWLADGAIGIMVPIFSLLFIINKYEEHVSALKRDRTSKYDPLQWTATVLISIGLIWFVVGVFPIMPSVIATGSMKPMIHPGDIVLLEQVRSKDQIDRLKKGDIIQFQRDDIRITHRIIKIEKDKQGNLSFHTKGDNNSSEDSRIVHPKDIKGVYLQVIPKLGYPTLFIKGRVSDSPSGVEF